MKRKITKLLLAGAFLGTGALASQAAQITFSGSQGSLAASVTFSIVGTDLHVTLANTSSGNPAAPSDILTAVLFNVAGDLNLTPVSATLSAGSSIKGSGGTDAGGVVGGEWAYNSGLSLYGANEGISSMGGNVFGPNDRFPGSNLEGPASPDGVQYGITTVNDTTANDNGGLSGNSLIKNSVDFVLSGFTGSLSDISNITFQYGTAFNDSSEPHFPPQGGPVPDGGTTIALLGFALVGIDVLRRRVSRA